MTAKETQNRDQALVIFGGPATVSNLPAAVQKAIERSGIKTREVAGIAPTWKPTEIGNYIIGEVAAIREGVGEFRGTVIVILTPKDGPQSVWLGADLKTKLSDVKLGQYYCIVYNGKYTKKDNPKLKNDMHSYSVVELLEPGK